MARNCHSARLYAATTRRAAEAADISVVIGEAGRGKFWHVADIDEIAILRQEEAEA